ncbi:MAG: AraC family transcriptional regulator [Leptolyngbyaceae cyanobacterium MO_188.B28]|nr:AraC family transcriptional regulator [Leptolyngbyaceae cyanobacterium MO_188.B28]
MSRKKPLTIDFNQEDSLSQILPRSPILSSQAVGWEAIRFLYHRQPAHEVPEFQSAQHVISIYTLPFRARRRVNGQWCNEDYASGDIGLFPARQTTPRSGCDREVGFINLFLEPTFFAKVAHESIDPDRAEILPRLRFRDPLIQQLGLALKTDLESGGVDSRFYAESMATALSVHLIRRYAAHQPTIKNYLDGLPPYKLRRTLDYIHDHLDQPLSLTELADLVQMSPHYFASMFKQSTGRPPYQYLTQCRIERAKQLLAQSESSIVEVSHQVGYQSQSHFTKVFRQYTGSTPRTYRNSL